MDGESERTGTYSQRVPGGQTTNRARTALSHSCIKRNL